MKSIYDNENLDELIALVTEKRTKEEWLASALNNIASLVKKTPKEYRTFGVYWWPVKRMLLDLGLIGGYINVEQEEICSTGDKYRDLAGALLYHEYCTNNFINENAVMVSDSDGISEEYLLIDDDLEARAFV